MSVRARNTEIEVTGRGVGLARVMESDDQMDVQQQGIYGGEW